MKSLIVKKFGGASVGSIRKIESIAQRLSEDRKRGEQPLVVLSAMSGYTDSLIQMAHKVHPHFQGEAYDMLVSSGEQISISLLSLALEKRGLKNKPLLAHQAGIQTSALFSKAHIESIQIEKVKALLKKKVMPLIAGFQGVTKQNEITTLGRGGSDLTAVALSSALKVKTCEIYTDVPGVFTADPRLVPKAKKQKSLSFSEMMEMSYLGSKVLQIRSVEMALKYDVKLHVRHAFKKEEGTWIINKKEGGMEGSVVSAIAHDLNTLVIKFNKTPSGVNFLSDLFTELGKEAVFVDIISQSAIGAPSRLSFSIPKTDLKKSLSVLKKLKVEKNISVINKVAKISVIGVGMASHSGVAGRFFSVIKKTKARLYLVTTSEIKISTVIDEKSLKKTARALHKEFNLY
ncbi:MAG: aspartate kinase [Oligoflexia bacterium]|nr:aspartate kinase [Oligoflexia bacterium]